MIFRLANIDDTNEILSMYEAVKNRQFCVWDDEYPTIVNINEDLSNNNLYVLEINNEIVGAISIESNDELDEYKCWKYPHGLEFTRVVVKPKYQHQGLARYMVSFMLEEIKRRGYDSAHISAAKENIPACKTYEKLKFNIVYEADMYGHRYYLLEKKV